MKIVPNFPNSAYYDFPTLYSDGGGGQQFALTAQAVCEHLDFLAQASGGGGLSVGLGEHGHIGPFPGSRLKGGDQLVEQGEEHLVDGVFHRHRHRGVVDVL